MRVKWHTSWRIISSANCSLCGLKPLTQIHNSSTICELNYKTVNVRTQCVLTATKRRCQISNARTHKASDLNSINCTVLIKLQLAELNISSDAKPSQLIAELKTLTRMSGVLYMQSDFFQQYNAAPAFINAKI